MNWTAALKEFTHYMRLERGLSQNTQEAYLRDLFSFVLYLEESGRQVLPAQVEPQDVEYYLGWLGQSERSARTQTRQLSSIRAFFKFMVLSDRVETSPCEFIEGPKLPSYLPTVLDLTEIDKMLGQAGNGPYPLRDSTMLEMLYSSGLRVSELVNLRIPQLIFDEGLLKVVGKGNKERLVPMSAPSMDLARQYLESERSKLFNIERSEDFMFLNRWGGNISRVSVFKLVKSLADRAGVAKNVSPHSLRHSFATHLVQGGADLRLVQEMLGHASISTTEIYTHLDRTQLQDAILKHHPRNKG